jgi:hypothetical protein
MNFLRKPSPFVLVAALLPVVALLCACGNGRSEALEDDSGVVGPPHPTPRGDDGGDPDGGCANLPDEASCIDPCGQPVAISCIDGNWQCPQYGDGYGYDCPIEDAGTDACSTDPPIACAQSNECSWSVPVCSGGQWTCQWNGNGECVLDAWVPPPDSGPPPPPDYNCGSIPCDPSTSFCQITAGGPVLEDGGSPTGFACLSLPACDAPATCACLFSTGTVPATCGCTGGAGQGEPLVIATCAVP